MMESGPALGYEPDMTSERGLDFEMTRFYRILFS